MIWRILEKVNRKIDISQNELGHFLSSLSIINHRSLRSNKNSFKETILSPIKNFYISLLSRCFRFVENIVINDAIISSEMFTFNRCFLVSIAHFRS